MLRPALARLSATAAFLIPCLASAHDMWLEPARFSVALGAEVAVRLKVGHETEVEAEPRKPERILRLEVVGATGAEKLGGAAGDDPVGRLTAPKTPGTLVLAYESNHAFIELDAEAFESYLEHEGLEAVKRARAERGESKEPGAESYARSAKALLTVGEGGPGFDRVVGLPLEIVPLRDPRVRGGPVEARLLSCGAPLAGARVDLMRLDDLRQARSSRTDEDGRVRFEGPGPGRYVLAATHMARVEEGRSKGRSACDGGKKTSSKLRGDWASDWATLTFEVREGADRAPAARPTRSPATR